MPPSTPEEKTVSENERLFKEHRDIGQEKEELPDKDEVEKFLKLPSNKGQVTHLRKVYNEGVSDVEKRYKQNERDVKKFANSQQRMDTLHEVAEAEGEDDNLSELREKALDIYNNPNSTADEIMAARNDYHQEVFKINDKMWDEQKQKVEGAVQDIEEKIAQAEEERDKFKRDKKKYDKKHREIVKLMGKRDKILSQVEKEEKLRLERAKSFSEEHLDVLKGGAKVQMQAQQAEIGEQEQVDERSKRISKLYKIIGGIAGFSAGALAGSAIVSSSILWLPVVFVGAIALTPKVEQKVKNLIISKFFNKREYEQLEQRIQNAGDNETEKQSLQAELQRREAALEKFQAASSSFFRFGTWGLIAGGVMGAAPSGTMTPGMYTEGIAVEGAAAESTIAEGAIAETEAITSIPETINVNDFSGGQEYTQYIEGLKEQNLLKGDNLLLTQELGGNVAQIQGELLKGVTEAGIPTEQINGRVFMDQVLEVNRSVANNQPFNLQGMVETVVNASTPIT